MASGLLLLVVLTTSLAAGLIVRGPGGGRRGLGRAIWLMLELAGLSTLFLAANLLLGVLLVLAIRSLSPLFVSAYVLNDVTLLMLSCLQGGLFFCWRRAREA